MGFGELGIMVYLGFTIGSIFGTMVFQYHSYTKYVLIVGMILNGSSLFMFTLVHDFNKALALRFVTGFF